MQARSITVREYAVIDRIHGPWGRAELAPWRAHHRHPQNLLETPLRDRELINE